MMKRNLVYQSSRSFFNFFKSSKANNSGELWYVGQRRANMQHGLGVYKEDNIRFEGLFEQNQIFWGKLFIDGELNMQG
jgi:hypothetical protein